MDEKVYNFTQFKSFWISAGELPKAKLQLTGKFAGQVVMPLSEEDPEQIRLLLQKHLPEEESKGDDFSDIFDKYLRF